MKYLQDDRLSNLTCRLQNLALSLNSTTGADDGGGGDRSSSIDSTTTNTTTTSRRRIHGRIEAYTMKRAGNDKKYAADLGSKYVEWQESLENELAVSSSSSTEEASALRKRSRSEDLGVLPEDRLLQPPWKLLRPGGGRSRALSLDAASAAASLSNPKMSILAATPLGDLRDLGVRRLMTDLILTLNMSFPDYDFGEVRPHDFERLTVPQVYAQVQSQLGMVTTAVDDNFAFTTSSSSNKSAAADETIAIASAASSTEDDQPLENVKQSSTSSSTSSSLLTTELWSAMDNVIHLADCEVYRWKNNAEDNGAGDCLLLSDYNIDDDNRDNDYSEDDDGVVDDEDNNNNGSISNNATRSILLWSFYYLIVNKTLKRIVFFGCCETMTQQQEGRQQQPPQREQHAKNDNEQYYSNGNDDAIMMSIRNDDDVIVVDEVADQDFDDDSDDDDGFDDEDVDESGDVDFDLDPAAVAAGGIPISTV